MWNETHKMLDPDIALTVTCVRVPVMVGHSEAVNIEFHEPLDEDEARDILREAPGMMVIDKRDATGYMTPKEAQGEFPVYRQPHPQRPDRRARPERCGWWPTTCARARPSTPCRSPSCCTSAA